MPTGLPDALRLTTVHVEHRLPFLYWRECDDPDKSQGWAKWYISQVLLGLCPVSPLPFSRVYPYRRETSVCQHAGYKQFESLLDWRGFMRPVLFQLQDPTWARLQARPGPVGVVESI